MYIYSKNASSHNHATCFLLSVQCCYRRPGAHWLRYSSRYRCRLRHSFRWPRLGIGASPQSRNGSLLVIIAALLCSCLRLFFFFNLSVIRNLRVSARHNILQWLTIKTVFCTQFVETFVFCPQTKSSIPRYKQYILNIRIARFHFPKLCVM